MRHAWIGLFLLSTILLAGGCLFVVDDNDFIPGVDTDLYTQCDPGILCGDADVCADVDVGDDVGIIAQGGLCTNECLDDLDCPINGLCLDFGVPYCYLPCFDDFDCPVLTACFDVIDNTGFDVSACLPTQ